MLLLLPPLLLRLLLLPVMLMLKMFALIQLLLSSMLNGCSFLSTLSAVHFIQMFFVLVVVVVVVVVIVVELLPQLLLQPPPPNPSSAVAAIVAAAAAALLASSMHSVSSTAEEADSNQFSVFRLPPVAGLVPSFTLSPPRLPVVHERACAWLKTSWIAPVDSIYGPYSSSRINIRSHLDED